MIKKLKQKIQNKLENFSFRINLGLGLMALFLAVAYLWQINTSTKLGLELESLRQRQSEALELSRDLQLSVANYQSIANLQERLNNLPLAKVVELDYIELTGSETVAKR